MSTSNVGHRAIMPSVNLELTELAPWSPPRQKQSSERGKLVPGWRQMSSASAIQTEVNPTSGGRHSRHRKGPSRKTESLKGHLRSPKQWSTCCWRPELHE